MKRMLGWLVVLTFGAVVCGLQLGCGGRAQEKAIEKAVESAAAKDGKKVDVDFRDGAMTIKTSDGESMNIDTKAGKFSMKGTEEGQEVKISADGDSFSMATPDGAFRAVSGKGAKVPDDFPKDVPVYAGAEILMATSMPGDEAFSIQAKTNDPMEKVGAFYKEKLAANGWAEQHTMSQTAGQPMQMITYSKADRMVMVMLTTEDEATHLNLTTGKN